MKMIRALFVVAVMLVPASWTLAHAGDEMGEAGKGGEMKKDKPMKKKPKKDSGDMGDMKKGDMDKK